MPIYEYKCQACGYELELLQKISEQPVRECPECHAQALQKLISASGFQLKGSGWYVTDFKDKGKGKGAPAATDNQSSTTVDTADTKAKSTTSSGDVPSTTSDN